MLLSPVLSVSYGRVDEFGGNPLRFMPPNSSILILIIGDSGAQRECNGWRGGGLAKFKGARFVCVCVCVWQGSSSWSQDTKNGRFSIGESHLQTPLGRIARDPHLARCGLGRVRAPSLPSADFKSLGCFAGVVVGFVVVVGGGVVGVVGDGRKKQ